MENIIHEITEIKDGFLAAIESCEAIRAFNQFEERAMTKLVLFSQESQQIVAKIKQFEDF